MAAEPYGPYGPSLSQPQLSNQPVNESPDDILMRLFTQFVQEKAPTPPATHLGAGQLFGLAVSGPLRNIVLQNMLNKQPGMQDYRQQEAQYEAHQKALGDISSMSGNLARSGQADEREQRLREQFAARMAMGRYTRVPIQGKAPDGSNVTYNLIYDNMLEKYYDQHGQEVDTSTISMPTHRMQYSGPGGEPIDYSTSTEGAIRTPVPVGVGTGASAGTPGIVNVPKPTEGGGQSAGLSNVLTKPRLGGPQKGGGKAHMGAAAASQQYAAQSAFMSGMEELKGIQGVAHEAQMKASGPIGMSAGGLMNYGAQAGKELMSHSQFAQPLLATMQAGPEIINYRVRMLPKLFQYVKSQTGVQFGYREFMQYSSVFPTSMDDEVQAEEKINSLVNMIKANRTELERQFHALSQAGTPSVGGLRLQMTPEQFEQMQSKDPQAAQNFLDDGGVIQ